MIPLVGVPKSIAEYLEQYRKLFKRKKGLARMYAHQAETGKTSILNDLTTHLDQEDLD